MREPLGDDSAIRFADLVSHSRQSSGHAVRTTRSTGAAVGRGFHMDHHSPRLRLTRAFEREIIPCRSCAGRVNEVDRAWLVVHSRDRRRGMISDMDREATASCDLARFPAVARVC